MRMSKITIAVVLWNNQTCVCVCESVWISSLAW